MEDLTKTHPNLIKEWDYSKNTILPTDVSFGSAKKVFWICPKGHSYEATVYSRASQNTGCSYIIKGRGFPLPFLDENVN